MDSFDDKNIKSNLSILDNSNIEYNLTVFSPTMRKVIIYFDNKKTIQYHPHSGHFYYMRRRYQTKKAYAVLNFIKKHGLIVTKPKQKKEYRPVSKIKINYPIKLN